MVISTALLCLAINIYHEARGEPVLGQYGVALVTMNRAQADEKVCKEVFRKSQFSWTTGVVKTKYGWKIPGHMKPIDQFSWNRAQTVARITLDGKIMDVTKGATHYHASYVNPYWKSAYQRGPKIGSHIFYRPRVSKSTLTKI